jgi:hypothetical protein
MEQQCKQTKQSKQNLYCFAKRGNARLERVIGTQNTDAEQGNGIEKKWSRVWSADAYGPI